MADDTEERQRVEDAVAELRGRPEAAVDAALSGMPWLSADEMDEIVDRAFVRHAAPEAEAKGVHTVNPLTDEIAGGSARAGVAAVEPAQEAAFQPPAAPRRLSSFYRTASLAER